MKKYRNCLNIPLHIAKNYLFDDMKAISKITKFYVNFDDWPVSIQGIQNDQFIFKGKAIVLKSSVEDVLNAIKENSGGTLRLKLKFFKESKGGGIFPKDVEPDIQLPVSFIGDVSIRSIYVKRAEVEEIAKRWDLCTLDYYLDELPKSRSKLSLRALEAHDYPDLSKVNNYNKDNLAVHVDILGAAFALALVMPNKCLNKNNDITAARIYELLEDHAHLFWPHTKKTALEVENNYRAIQWLYKKIN